MEKEIKRALQSVWQYVGADVVAMEGGLADRDVVIDIVGDQFTWQAKDLGTPVEVIESWKAMSFEQQQVVLEAAFPYEQYD